VDRELRSVIKSLLSRRTPVCYFSIQFISLEELKKITYVLINKDESIFGSYVIVKNKELKK